MLDKFAYRVENENNAEQPSIANQILKTNEQPWNNCKIIEKYIEQTIENIKHFYPKLAHLSSDKFDLDKFLSNAYTSMTNATSEGTGILAEQFKMHRIFEFKSPDALMSYNKKYGHQNILHAVFQNMEMFQKYLTLGETMGFGRVITKPIKNPKPGGPTQVSEVFNPVLDTRKMFQALKDMGKLSPTDRHWGKLSPTGWHWAGCS